MALPRSEDEKGLLPSGLNNRLVQRTRVRGSFAPASLAVDFFFPFSWGSYLKAPPSL